MSEKHSIVSNPKSSILRSFVSRQIKEFLTTNFWRAVVSEIFGTLFLCAWTIGSGLTKEGESVDIVDLALTAGFTVGVTIQALQNASGANINPAISIGLLAVGKISVIRFVFYVIAQVIAGLLAACLIQGVFPAEMWGTLGLISPGNGVSDWQAFGCEFCITFFLLFGTCAFIDSDRKDVKGAPGFFVGLIVAVNVFFAARISGACMNPARNFGPAVVTGKLEKQWIYWFGPLLGAVCGALVYEKLLSARAMSTTCVGGCIGGSSDQNIGDAFESEIMMDERKGQME